jgi:hypothetical protein
MKYIKAVCKTNLDDYICPITSFVSVPEIGHSVEVKYKGKNTTLKVVAITHLESFIREPYIVVELNK